MAVAWILVMLLLFFVPPCHQLCLCQPLCKKALVEADMTHMSDPTGLQKQQTLFLHCDTVC